MGAQKIMGKLFSVTANPSPNRNEELMFNELAKQLELVRAKHTPDDFWLLIKSMNVGGGSETDAVLFRSRSVTVIELKNYEGDLMPGIEKVPMDGNWRINNKQNGPLQIKGHRLDKNPFQQVKQYRNQLKSTLSQNANKLYKSANDVHAQAIVVFKHLDPAFSNFMRLDGSITKWFGIYDLKHGFDDLMSMGHDQMPDITAVDIKYLLERFNVYDQLEQQDQELLDQAIMNSNPGSTPQAIEKLVYPEREISLEVLKELELEQLDLASCDLSEVYRTVTPGRAARTAVPNHLNEFGEHASKFISGYNLYTHQAMALDLLHEGKDVCLATSTASGKSEVFFAHALSIISKKPEAKVLVMYPMKALNKQQSERWETAFEKAGIAKEKIARIDGSVPVKTRGGIIGDANVIVATPDVVHAWFMRMKDSPGSIKKFIKNLELIVLDEAHLYNGVFGTNMAFLLRRLNALAMQLSNRVPQYLMASGTLDQPEKHLKDLSGRDFIILGEDEDGSPEYRKTIIFADANQDTFVSFGKLVNQLIALDKQSITFTNGRVMAEYFTRAVNKRPQADDFESLEETTDELVFDENQAKAVEDLTTELKDRIAVYRSGLEQKELTDIQDKLQDGTLRAVVSTSALEVGIDLKDLSVCILAGVPSDGAALKQRLGRVGRKKDGLVIILNDKTEFSKKVFRKPSTMFFLPYPKSCIYLENENMKRGHAHCLFVEMGHLNHTDSLPIQVSDLFPDSFVKEYERILKAGDADVDSDVVGGDIHLKLNLRDAEPQWDLLFTGYPNSKSHPLKVGTITYSQMMREAYPGATYLHGGRGYKVAEIKQKGFTREIYLEKGSAYATTKPDALPTSVKINELTDEWKNLAKLGTVKTFLSPCFPQQFVKGVFSGQDGKTLTPYPVNFKDKKGFSYSDPLFGRKIKTTGFVLVHDVLSVKEVDAGQIARVMLMAYTGQYAIAKADMASAVGKFRTNGNHFQQGQTFISIYDDLERGLNLCADLCVPDVLIKVLAETYEVLERERAVAVDGLIGPNEETLNAVRTLLEEAQSNEQELVLDGPQKITVMEGTALHTETGLRAKIKRSKYEDGSMRYFIMVNGESKWVDEDKLEPIEDVTDLEEMQVKDLL